MKGFLLKAIEMIRQNKDHCLRFIGIRSVQSIPRSHGKDATKTVAAIVGLVDDKMTF